MLLGLKNRNAIEKKIKAQKSLLVQLEKQELAYSVDYSIQKNEIIKSLNYYEKVLKEEE